MSTRLHAPLLFAVLLAVPACRGFPDPPPGFQGTFTPDAILLRALGENEDGEPKPPAGKDLLASVSIERFDAEPPVTDSFVILWMEPDHLKVEQRGPGGVNRQFFLVAEGWVEVQDGAVVRNDVPVQEVPVDRLLRHIFILRYFLSGPGGKPDIEKTFRTQDGRYTIVISKRDGGGRKWQLALDSQTLKPTMVREWCRLEGDAYGPLDTYYGSFGVDSIGNSVPRTMKSFADGRLIQELRIRDLSWNQGLRSGDFRVPGR